MNIFKNHYYSHQLQLCTYVDQRLTKFKRGATPCQFLEARTHRTPTPPIKIDKTGFLDKFLDKFYVFLDKFLLY